MNKKSEFFTKKIHGPIAIFGAGGFIGINLLNTILSVRKDVIGVSSDPEKNWRIQKNQIPPSNVVKCDLMGEWSIREFVQKFKPQTIYNLAAYGAYPTQRNLDKIYQTNFNSTYVLIEELKKSGFKVYLQAGSQSEYGLNSNRPSEEDELIPNSHYAVSKTADYNLLKYYGKIEKLPVVHLRFYSVYGSWEGSDRLIPTLIREAKRGNMPPFVAPNISRDFVYVDDVIEAMVMIASKIKESYYGEAFNICSGKKTTIKELACLAKRIFKIKAKPKFGKMKNRSWDLKDWYGNPTKTNKIIGWRVKTSLEAGLMSLFLR